MIVAVHVGAYVGMCVCVCTGLGVPMEMYSNHVFV